MSQLLTPRLRLRRAEASDLAAFHAILSHPVAMRYWSTLPHTSLDQTRAWLDGMIGAPPETSDDFVVEFEGRVVGKAGFYRLPEVGFILHPAVWGLGLAREAVSAVIARAFERFDLAEVVADVDPRNAASLALLKGMGFQQTGYAERTFQLGAEWCDSVYLALRRPAPSS